MKRTLSSILSLSLLLLGCGSAAAEGNSGTLLYQGHGSLRIVTGEGKVIYIDPYAGKGYDLPADLILVTHAHQDHTAVNLNKNRNEGSRVITWRKRLSAVNTKPLTWATPRWRPCRPATTKTTISKSASAG